MTCATGILRLSHAEVRVPDLQLAIAYYAEVIGLMVTDTEPGRAYLKGWDEHQHHSLILAEEPTYGLNALAFKVMELPELDRLAERVTAAGIAVERFDPGTELPLGRHRSSGSRAPSGHVIDLEHGQLQVGNGLALINPPPAPEELVGMHPPRIDHIFLLCEDVDGDHRLLP